MCLNDIFLVDLRKVLKIERGESVMITPYASFQNLIKGYLIVMSQLGFIQNKKELLNYLVSNYSCDLHKERCF